MARRFGELAPAPARRVPRRPLRAGLDLTRVGLDLSTARCGDPADRDAVRACLRAAIAARLNWVDVGGSAPLHALVAGVLEQDGTRRPALVATIAADVLAASSRRTVAREVRGLAEGLGVDRVDVLLADCATGIREATWHALREQAGGAHADLIGLRDPAPDVLVSCHEQGGVDVVSITAGIAERAAIADMLGWCVASGVDVLARVRLSSPQSPALDEALRVAEMRHGNPADVVAIAWVLAWPGITSVAFPAHSGDAVDRRADAAQLKLSAADLDVIAAALRSDGGDDDGFERPRVRA